MRKMLSFVVFMLIVFSSFTNVFAEDTISIRITDVNGNEIKADKPIEAGEDFVIEYTIQPEDIEVDNDVEANVDITFVVDLSGSMKYIDAEMSYEVFKDKYATKYDVFEEWKANALENYGNIYRVKNWSDIENNFKGSNDPKLLDYYKKYFLDRYYLEINVNGLDEDAGNVSYSKSEWCTEEELKVNYNSKDDFINSYNSFAFKTETRLDAEKRAINNFLDSLAQMEGVDAKISLVGFNNGVTVNANQLSVDEAKEEVSKMTAIGMTNSGEGLLNAYYKNINNNEESNKYVIYVSDGATTAALLKNNGVIVDSETIDSSKIVYHIDDSKEYIRFNQNTYDEKVYYVNYTENSDGGIIPSDSYDFGYNLARDYIYNVAGKYYNNQNSSIDKFYVVGIGDQKGGNKAAEQSIENKSICGLANGIYKLSGKESVVSVVNNADEELKKLYFPLSNASELGNAFSEIINDIANSVKTKETKFEIPFVTKVKKANNVVGQIPEDLVLIKDVVVEEIVDGQATAIKSDFTIVEKNENGSKTFSLQGDLQDGFTYNYDKKSNKYKANPIRIKIFMHAPENYAKEGIEIKEGGSLSYKVNDSEPIIELPGRSIAVKPDYVDLVDATLTIDEIAKKNLLTIIPKENFGKISLTYENGNLIAPDATFSNKNKGENLTYNISDAALKELSKTGKLYLAFEKTVGGVATSYKEVVHVMVSDGISYNIDRYGVKYPNYDQGEEVAKDRNVGFRIKSADDLDKIIYTYEGKTSELPVTTIDGSYEEKMLLKDVDYLKEKGTASGKTNVDAKFKNKSNNVTILKTAALVKARGPVLENINVKGTKLYADVASGSENLRTVTIPMYDLKGNHVKNATAVITTNKRGFVAEIGDTKDFTVKIDAVDVNNNGTITKVDISLESGIYDKAKSTYRDGTKVIPGIGYTFAIEFNYTGSGDIEYASFVKESDGTKKEINTKIMNGYILKNVNTGATYTNGFETVENGNKITFKSKGTLPAGEYIILFNMRFEKDKNVSISDLSEIITNVTYNGFSEKKYPVNTLPLLQ